MLLREFSNFCEHQSHAFDLRFAVALTFAGWARIGQSGRMRRMLLTSAGVRNVTIDGALLDTVGPTDRGLPAMCIPTVLYGHPYAGPGQNAWEFVAGRSEQPMVELGWKSVGLLS